MSVDRLAPKIRQILSAPDTDLSTVSAKRVRKQLVELHPEITLDFVKQNKDAIDVLIGSIFESMNSPDAGVGVGIEPTRTVSANANGKRKRGNNGRNEDFEVDDEGNDSQGENERASEDDEAAESHAPVTPPPKRQKKTKVQAVTDEEYARQLSSELNQRPSRGGRNTNGTSKKGASRTPKKVKKSRAQIEDDSDVEEDGMGGGSSRLRKPAKAAKKSGGGAKGGFAKEFALSEPLAAVIEKLQLSRPQVVKKLWEYIKGHELQNPKNKKEILCDDALRAVFNADKIDMFTMNKTLGQHLYDIES